ncbi:MAG: hypothetical protein U1A78_37830 [Polyangia bacterium]
MLQIISGKFFRSNERHVFPAKGVLFSNYSWIRPIETCIGTLEPIEHRAATLTYVFSYRNQIEKTGTMIRGGDAEIVNQFRILCSFGLEAYFSLEKSQVEHICRDKPKNSGDAFVPARFVRRVFSPSIQGTMEETVLFSEFVKKVISLKRERYTAVINCLQNLNDALDVLSYNIDLSYSMLVYCLEALCQKFDQFKPTWQNYSTKTRSALDALIENHNLDPSVGEKIRNILLEDAHVQLMSRFLEFTMSHISENFFTQEALKDRLSLPYSLLRQSLINAYTLRSKYVHTLRPIQDHLRHAELVDGDVFVWEKEPYLTISGLHRLVRHVIRNFISNSESIEKEDYDWQSELPGIITLRFAPEYWIWTHDRITVPMKKEILSPIVRDKFWGLVTHLLVLPLSGGTIPDLRELLAKYELLIPQAAQIDKVRMLGTYLLYNFSIVSDARSSSWPEFFDRHESILMECCIETMFLSLYINDKLQ